MRKGPSHHSADSPHTSKDPRVQRAWDELLHELPAAIALEAFYSRESAAAWHANGKLIAEISARVGVLAEAIAGGGLGTLPESWIGAARQVRFRSALITVLVQLMSLDRHGPPIYNSAFLQNSAMHLEAAIIRVAELDRTQDYRVIFSGNFDVQKANMMATQRGVRTLGGYVNACNAFQPSARLRQRPPSYHRGSVRRTIMTTSHPALTPMSVS